MRIANVAGRLALIVDGKSVDVATASQGRFEASVQAVYARWEEFLSWARAYRGEAGAPFREKDLGPPVPMPPQVFAIGVNYGAHAAEAGLDVATRPVVFTKFPASITGPYDDVVLPRGSVDFEIELVAIIGTRTEGVRAEAAWQHVAGLTVGQDLSEREMQLSGPTPQQFSIAKSFKGFGPIGPFLVTPDEFANPDDLELGCSINGESMQKSRTGTMIFSIPQIIAFLSGVLPLLPGDVIFTGTPAGIGWGRNPKRLLGPKDELVSYVLGIGEMRHHFVEGKPEVEAS